MKTEEIGEFRGERKRSEKRDERIDRRGRKKTSVFFYIGRKTDRRARK